MSDEIRHVFVNGKIVQASGDELAAILAVEAVDPAISKRRTVDANQVELMRGIRSERDRLLGESDWTQYADSPLTTEQKTAWAAYRTLLRDFPATFIDEDGETVLVTILDPIVWPTKPT